MRLASSQSGNPSSLLSLLRRRTPRPLSRSRSPLPPPHHQLPAAATTSPAPRRHHIPRQRPSYFPGAAATTYPAPRRPGSVLPRRLRGRRREPPPSSASGRGGGAGASGTRAHRLSLPRRRCNPPWPPPCRMWSARRRRPSSTTISRSTPRIVGPRPPPAPLSTPCSISHSSLATHHLLLTLRFRSSCRAAASLSLNVDGTNRIWSPAWILRLRPSLQHEG